MDMYDTAIIGGGASGLMAAAKLCRAGRSVLLLEGADRVGKKLLSTGSGRCNLSNISVDPQCYRGSQPLPAWFLDKYSPGRISEEFRSLGLLLREDREGRIYPYSLRANTVLDILRKNIREAQTVCSCEIIRAEKDGTGYRIEAADGRSFSARTLILACGGSASAQLSSGKTGYALARMLGHSIVPVSPALCAVVVSQKEVRPLAGIRCRARASLLQNGEVIASDSGEVQFTDRTLSGICIFNLSRFAGPGMQISLDLLPEYTADEIEAFLPGGEQARDLFEGVLHPRLVLEALKKRGISLSGYGLERSSLLAVKDFRFEVQELDSMQRAQVTAGGVPLSETDISRMESRICGNLYLTGEILDVDGICGGYNLHFAWSTALCAVQAILDSFAGGLLQ